MTFLADVCSLHNDLGLKERLTQVEARRREGFMLRDQEEDRS